MTFPQLAKPNDQTNPSSLSAPELTKVQTQHTFIPRTSRQNPKILILQNETSISLHGILVFYSLKLCRWRKTLPTVPTVYTAALATPSEPGWESLQGKEEIMQFSYYCTIGLLLESKQEMRETRLKASIKSGARHFTGLCRNKGHPQLFPIFAHHSNIRTKNKKSQEVSSRASAEHLTLSMKPFRHELACLPERHDPHAGG